MRSDVERGVRPPGSIEPAAIRAGSASADVRANACVRPGNRVVGADGVASGDRRSVRQWLGDRRSARRRPGAVGAGGRRVRAAFRARGFTLLETMVALVIFAGAAMALYALFNTNLIALARAHDVSRQLPAVRHAIEHLSAINPREVGDGSVVIDGLDVTWTATLVQPPRQSQTMIGGRGFYEIGLYEIEFSLSNRRRTLGTWRLRSVGYEKVREPEF